MGKIILDLKIQYDSFSKSEKKIADFVMENPNAILPMYITELAERSGSSEATIVRFCRKLGFDGYQQFKLALAKSADVRPVSENITASDSAYDILSKVCEDIYCSLEKTKQTIDENALQICCDKLLSAEKILIFGLGNSASVALDACHKMFRLGLNAVAYTDNHMQAIASAHTNNKSVVIGISHSGHSRDIVQAMQTAKNRGATTISLTSEKKSPIVKSSDVVLYTVSDETNYRILGLSSRIAQLTIIDTIYSYLVCHINNSEEKIALTESSLKPKKF
ncbi:MAG: MurR/RpiR family transcriptional regulator [Clostridia bacterium]|nr:MurR/RpiR family transcriptional regulator [Clostridia bacterium]